MMAPPIHLGVWSMLWLPFELLTLGAHAQRGGYSTCFVCLCVCVFVCYRSSSVSVCNQRHLRHSFRLFLLVDIRKTLPLKSYGEKKPICKLVIAHREPFSRTFWTNETQELLEAQPVNRILLQTLATGAAGVK